MQEYILGGEVKGGSAPGTGVVTIARHLGGSGGMNPQEFFLNSKVSEMDSGAI